MCGRGDEKNIFFSLHNSTRASYKEKIVPFLSRLRDLNSVKYWQSAHYGLLVEMGGVEPPSKHRTR